MLRVGSGTVPSMVSRLIFETSASNGRDQKRDFGVSTRLWRETLKDTLNDIKTYREAAKVKVKKEIRNRTKEDDGERKRLHTLLKYDRWMEDNYLRRMMRKYYKHGKISVDNQIVLESDGYEAFERNDQAWINVPGLVPRKRIAIPLNTSRVPSGTLHLILRGGKAEVHYTVHAEIECATPPCGEGALGIDKGYTEAFTDSDRDRHGEELGKILSAESDYLKAKYQSRSNLKAIAEAKPHKRDKYS